MYSIALAEIKDYYKTLLLVGHIQEEVMNFKTTNHIQVLFTLYLAE
jgi:hypothetical protein